MVQPRLAIVMTHGLFETPAVAVKTPACCTSWKSHSLTVALNRPPALQLLPQFLTCICRWGPLVVIFCCSFICPAPCICHWALISLATQVILPFPGYLNSPDFRTVIGPVVWVDSHVATDGVAEQARAALVSRRMPSILSLVIMCLKRSYCSVVLSSEPSFEDSGAS